VWLHVIYMSKNLIRIVYMDAGIVKQKEEGLRVAARHVYEQNLDHKSVYGRGNSKQKIQRKSHLCLNLLYMS
jgi:hypothetical protein